MKKLDFKKLREAIEEELVNIAAEANTMKEPDHEGRMARGEIGAMITNANKLYSMIGKDDELPGWVSAYITLASDYINSVTQYMVENSSGKEDEQI